VPSAADALHPGSVGSRVVRTAGLRRAAKIRIRGRGVAGDDGVQQCQRPGVRDAGAIGTVGPGTETFTYELTHASMFSSTRTARIGPRGGPAGTRDQHGEQPVGRL